MKKVVHIIPVGHTKLTLTEGMRQFPFHKIILVLGKERTPGEEKAINVANDIEKEFGAIAEIEYLHVDMDDIYMAAIDMAKTIKAEQDNGNTVKVNTSGSLRTMGISSYLACSVTGAEMYLALPSYKNGSVTGITQIIEVSSFPLKEVGSEELSILSFLLERRAVGSVDELIQWVNKKSKGSKGYLKERARMSYHIKKLREGGFIETEKRGKNLGIILTKLGELYSVGRG